MKLIITIITVSSIFLNSASAPASDDKSLTAGDILRKSVRGTYTQSEESTYLMRLTEGDGKQIIRKMRVWFKRGDEESAKLMIKFLEPADIRNTGILSIVEKGKPADQWLYLPAVKKVRRIKGGNENEAFLGSDFTVGDLTSMDNDEKRYEYTVTDTKKKCGDVECYLITGAPKSDVDPSTLPYSKKVIEVRKDNFVAHRVDFFNPAGQLEKTLEVKSVHLEAGKHWLADKMEMKNVLTNHSTAIEIQKRDVKTPSDSVFTQSYLERN